VVFVGHLYPQSELYSERRRLLALLGERYDVAVYDGVYFEDAANLMATGRVVFNRNANGTLPHIPARVFEGMCSGRPLVTDYSEQLTSLLGDASQYRRDGIGYEDEQELWADVWRLLRFSEERIECANAQREAVLAAHTYRHRARAMLEAIGA